MSQRKLPKYRKQRSSSGDRAFVEIEGRRYYLGAYDSTESRDNYRRTIAEWLNGMLDRPKDPKQMTVVELALAFWRYAKTFYRHPDGSRTSSLDG